MLLYMSLFLDIFLLLYTLNCCLFELQAEHFSFTEKTFCLLTLSLVVCCYLIRWGFDRYDELASKSNVEYIAGGNVSYNMFMQLFCP